MGKRGRPPKLGGAVYKRENSEFWQVRYKDQKGEIIRESTGTSDRHDAERFLRDRLDARDDGNLGTLLTSKQLTFNQWADWFMERRSKPPFRSEGNHQQNVNALKFLRPVLGNSPCRRSPPRRSKNIWGTGSSPGEGFTRSWESSCAEGSSQRQPVRNSGFCRTS